MRVERFELGKPRRIWERWMIRAKPFDLHVTLPQQTAAQDKTTDTRQTTEAQTERRRDKVGTAELS